MLVSRSELRSDILEKVCAVAGDVASFCLVLFIQVTMYSRYEEACVTKKYGSTCACHNNM